MKKIILSSLLFYCLHLSYAQTGNLDISFGTKGFAKTDMGSPFGIYNSQARQVLINPDGSGGVYVLLNDAFFSKRFANGAIDSSYGFNGYSSAVPFTNAAAAIINDGKMVIVGSQSGSPSFFVARLKANGALDSTFGTNGLQSTLFSGASFAKSVAIQGDGKIVVTGSTTVNSIPYFATVRYNLDGSLDKSFNKTGQQITSFESTSQSANTVAIQADGKVVVGGAIYTDLSGYNFAVIRYKTDGSIDSTFGTNGKQTTLAGLSDAIAYSIAIQPIDGKIVLAGYTKNSSGKHDFAVVRYNLDGSLDASLNTNGIKVISLSSDGLIGNSVALQSTGKIVVAGYSSTGTINDFAIARLNADGTTDNSFNGNGMVATDINASDDYAVSVAIGNEDKMVVAGYSVNGSGVSNFVLTRYTDNGSLDNTFNTDGKLSGSYKQGYTSYNATAVQKDGKIVTAGATWNGVDYDFALARYNTNGKPDSSFNGTGIQITDFGAIDSAISIVIQADNKIVVAGNSGNVNAHFVIARYNTNGTIDNTFGTNGKQTIAMGFADVFGGMALQADGKIVLAGYTYSDVSYNNVYFAIARLNTDGTLDNSFSGTGKQLTQFNGSASYATTVAVQKIDGKIVAAGRATLNGQNNYAIARYNVDGTLDNTFSNDGMQNNVFNNSSYVPQSIAIQDDGKIILAGYPESPSSNTSSFGLIRYQLNGELDATFGTGGFQSTTIGVEFPITKSSIAIKNDGRIAVGGSNNNYAIVLYKINGTPDSTFGSNGIQVTSTGLGGSSIQCLAFAGEQLYAAGCAQYPGTFGTVARYLFAAAGPLPVTLTTFTATIRNKKTTLVQWQTESEQNLAGFTVERSTSSNNFSPIGYTTAKGNSSIKVNYSTIDPQPVFGINYYRLKMIDIDAKFVYSKIIPITITDAGFTLILSPNPVKNTLYIKATGSNENAVFVIIDGAGKKVSEVKAVLNGATSVSIDINALAKGAYTLQLQTATLVQTRRFIKE